MSAQTVSSDYRLTEEDLEEYPIERYHYDPVVRAAANPDGRVLAAILVLKEPHLGPSTFDCHESALTSAIKAGLERNVKVLLEAGCNPNGVPYNSLLEDITYFWRLLPHWSPLASHMPQETDTHRSPLDDEDIRSRQRTRLQFWSGPIRGYPVPGQKPLLTAMDAAVLSGNIDLVKAVLDAGPDIKAWMESHDSIPDNPTVSYICPSTPLHRAIESGNIEVTRFLLEKGFRVDVFPLAAVTRCMNPLMYSLAARSSDLSWYELFSESPTANHAQVTPIFKVHIAHVACATISVPVLEAVSKHVPLKEVHNTALGHSLLHIVCLPLKDGDINHFSSKIHQSIHDVRSLDATYPRLLLWPYKSPGQFRDAKPSFTEKPSDELSQQLRMISYLKSQGIKDWVAKDVHGNTPLHYLASHRSTTKQTLVEGLAEEDVGNAWSEQNNWGHTPLDLLEDGRDALEKLADEGQAQENVRYMPHWRDPMGVWLCGIWRSRYPEDQ